MAGAKTDIELARDAVRREAWTEAYVALSELDPATLQPEDLESLADAAWWTSHTEVALAVRQRAHAVYSAAGNEVGAGGTAVRLCMEHFLRGEGAVGAGWLMRAQRHLRDRPDTVAHGYLAMAESTVARRSGEVEGAAALAERAADIGRRTGNRDLIAAGIQLEGMARIHEGRVAEGLALLDEAMTSVVAGELSSFVTGLVYCNVLEACLELADVRRAGEWNSAAKAWCDSLPEDAPYPGYCRVNRAEIAALSGDWAEAAAEAERASEELLAVSPAFAAQAFYESGELRRGTGDLAGAEAAYARAGELGLEPQPGLALLRLAQGRPDAAMRALQAAIGGDGFGRLRRARLLAAFVEVALERPDLTAADDAAGELAAIAEEFGTASLRAAAEGARGALALARADVAAALRHLRLAASTYREARMPYEAARVRVRYARALRAAGDEDDARLELRAALATFDRLGAAPDTAAASALLDERPALPSGLTAREAEVLRLVASGKSNRDIADALVISEHTVARHLQNIFAKLSVSSRSAATAFAFEHGLA